MDDDHLEIDSDAVIAENDIEIIYSDSESDEEYVEELQQEQQEELEAEVVDLAKLTFRRHTGSVFCGTLSKNGLLAATGGEDDLAYVWSTETCEVLLECTGHKDSVTEIAFNFDDQYVATGDMGGLIQVWSVKNKQLVWCYEGDDLEWLLWHPLSNVLFAGTHAGDIFVWQIPKGNCKVLPSYGSASTCGQMLPDNKRLLVGYSDGQLRLWDIKSTSVVWQLNDNLPAIGITSLAVTNDSNLFIVAPTAQVFKVNDGQLASVMLANNEQDVETIAINNELGLVATGALSGKLCVWDLKKNTIRHENKLDSPVTILKWGLQEQCFAGATDGCVYVCDAKLGTLLHVFTGHNADILSLSVTSDASTILTTSDDGTAKLFSVNRD